MAKTASQLVREISSRLDDLVFAQPTSGTATTLVDQKLLQWFPVDVINAPAYVYGVSTTATFGGTSYTACDAANQGLERIAKGWTASTTTLTLQPPGMATNMTTGTYEIRKLWPRSRILEYLNEAIGLSGCYWARSVMDASITTAANTWSYTLPSSQNWQSIEKIELQISTTQPTFPYVDMTPLNWRPEKTVDTSGNEVWKIQFEDQPPQPFNMHVWGRAFYADVANETDILAISGEWERKALAWIYSWAIMLAQEQREASAASLEAAKIRDKKRDVLTRALDALQKWAPENKGGRVIIPGVGDGTYHGQGSSPDYLNANEVMGLPQFNPAL